MSRRDDQFDDQYNGYNDRYQDRGQDAYDGGFNDGYGSYSNGSYSDYDQNNDNYDDGRDDGYTDRYGNRYGDDTDHAGYDDRDAYEDAGAGRYQDDYDDGYDSYDQSSAGEYDDGYEDYADEGYGDDQAYEEDYDQAGYEDYGEEDAGSREAGRRARAQVSTRVKRAGDGGGKKKRRIVLLVIEIAALLVVVFVLYAVTRVTKVGKADLSQSDIEDNIDDTVKANAAMKGYRNIALFGVDSTEGQLDQKTRSDTIMIASVNEDTGDVKLVSVYRDTLLDLTGADDADSDDAYNKINAAYAKGGPEQAINALNTNLDMNITDFVTVGFGGLTDVVNALGGVDIDVTQDEIVHLNNYQSTMAQELKMNYTEVTEAGLQTLNGLQATAYCRIRYTKGWDYKRAARQRAVLYAIFNKAKQADPAALTEIANNAFNEIYTSMDLSTLVEYVSALSRYNIQAEDSIEDMANGFPQETARIQANLGNALGDCVVPRTLSNNVIWLHQFLFNDADYQPSDTVQKISDKIDDMTRDAVPEEMTDADHT